MTDMRYPQVDIDYAKEMLACPWYREEGSCESGCCTEPVGMTDCPPEGWAVIATAKPLDEVEAAWSWRYDFAEARRIFQSGEDPEVAWSRHMGPDR